MRPAGVVALVGLAIGGEVFFAHPVDLYMSFEILLDEEDEEDEEDEKQPGGV
jgi:hypothetical protein